MIAGMLMCATLTAVDGDTVRCDGQLMRLLGGEICENGRALPYPKYGVSIALAEVNQPSGFHPA